MGCFCSSGLDVIDNGLNSTHLLALWSSSLHRKHTMGGDLLPKQKYKCRERLMFAQLREGFAAAFCLKCGCS